MRKIFRLSQTDVLFKWQRKRKKHTCLIFAIHLIFYSCIFSYPTLVPLHEIYTELPNTDGSGMTELVHIMSLYSFILFLLGRLIFCWAKVYCPSFIFLLHYDFNFLLAIQTNPSISKSFTFPVSKLYPNFTCFSSWRRQINILKAILPSPNVVSLQHPAVCYIPATLFRLPPSALGIQMYVSECHLKNSGLSSESFSLNLG